MKNDVTWVALEDASRAREYAKAAVDPHSALYRTIGPDRLLALAQVYATLSTR